MLRLDHFFKKDHLGGRKPTVLFLVILSTIVFGSYFLSQNDEKQKDKIKPQEEIITSKDMAHRPAERQSVQSQEDMLKPLLFAETKEKKQAKTRRESPDLKRGLVNHKPVILVYDNSQESNQKKTQVRVPLGSMVHCLLVHNIITNNFSSPVIIQVEKDFYFNGELLFAHNTRIFGEARAGRERDRVLVAFRTILYEDGYEVNFKGRGLDFDGSGGLKAEIISEKNREKILAKVLHFVSGTLLGLQEKATNAVTGINQVDETSRNAILEGSAMAFTEEAKRLEAEIKEAAGYAIVPAGTRMILYVDESFDVKKRERK
jgi:hypothetical protein